MDPPPTKWTISSRSPSFSVVSDQEARGAISRLSSTATRSDFMPRDSTSAASVSGDLKSFCSPLIWRVIGNSLRKAVGIGKGGRPIAAFRTLERAALRECLHRPAISWGSRDPSTARGDSLCSPPRSAQDDKQKKMTASRLCGGRIFWWRCGLRSWPGPAATRPAAWLLLLRS